MKTFQATFLSLLITGIAFARAQNNIVVIYPANDSEECVKVLDHDGSTHVLLEDCDSSRGKWIMGPPNQSSEIMANSNSCLDAGTTTPSSNVVTAQCDGSAGQLWITSAQGSGTVTTIKLSNNTNICLDQLISSNTRVATRLQTNTCNGADTQSWAIMNSGDSISASSGSATVPAPSSGSVPSSSGSVSSTSSIPNSASQTSPSEILQTLYRSHLGFIIGLSLLLGYILRLH